MDKSISVKNILLYEQEICLENWAMNFKQIVFSALQSFLVPYLKPLFVKKSKLNYLSHYYIDHQLSNHYYNAALFLPDFTRKCARGYEVQSPDLNNNQLALQLGCISHLKADKAFHSSVFFKKYSQQLNIELQNFKPLAHLNRKWFLAHIIFEMLIDRLLVKYFPGTCHSFYNDLNQIDTKTLNNFVLRFSYKNIDSFIQNFNHFCKVKYLFGYAFDEGFIYSIVRVYKEATKIELSMSDRLFLKHFVNHVEQLYFYDPMMMMIELKQVFLEKS